MLSTGTGEQWTDAFLHRVRGKILLKRDPTNSVPAEVASSQPLPSLESRTRSFELRAALTLAKLYQLTSYQSASRSQLCAEGFSPKPEFPEIAEAQALLAALA